MKRILSLVVLILGVSLIAGGNYTFDTGKTARDEVRAGLAQEKVVTGEDASVPNAPVVDGRTAKVQAETILKHTLKATNGKMYAEMKRDDPARATAASGAALRMGLMMAYGFDTLSSKTMGAGTALTSAGWVLLAALGLFWLLSVVWSFVGRQLHLRRLRTRPVSSL